MSDPMLPPHELIEALWVEWDWEVRIIERLSQLMYADHSAEKVNKMAALLNQYEAQYKLETATLRRQLTRTPEVTAQTAWRYAVEVARRFMPGPPTRELPAHRTLQGLHDTLRAYPRFVSWLRWLGAGRPRHMYLDWMKTPPSWYRGTPVRVIPPWDVTGPARPGRVEQFRPAPGLRLPEAMREVTPEEAARIRAALSPEQRAAYDRLRQIASAGTRYAGRAVIALAILQTMHDIWANYELQVSQASLSTWKRVSITLFGRDVLPELLTFGRYFRGAGLCFWSVSLYNVPQEYWTEPYTLIILRTDPDDDRLERRFTPARIHYFNTPVPAGGQRFTIRCSAPWLRATEPPHIDVRVEPGTRTRELRFRAIPNESREDYYIDLHGR